MNERVTVDITEVEPEATKVLAKDLRLGDVVFDAMGGRYELVSVARQGKWVATQRNDGWRDKWLAEEDLTIIRPTVSP